MVRYEVLGTIYRAQAMFKKNVGCFYSYEFTCIPVRQLDVVREINTD